MDRSDIREQVRMVLPPEVTDVSDTMINTLINQALKECSVASKWPFLHSSTTISTVAAQQNYALPADFLYGLKIVDDDKDTELEYIAPAQWLEWYGNATQESTATTATRFTIYNDEILLGPTPSAIDADRYTLYYYREITELALDTDVPEFLDTFHWLVVEWVKAKLYEREGMVQEASRSFGMYADYIDRMRQWYTTPIKREPWVAGDGFRRRIGDPNLPILNYIQ